MVICAGAGDGGTGLYKGRGHGQRSEAGQREADLWDWAAVSSRLESIFSYPFWERIIQNWHQISFFIQFFQVLDARIDMENQNKCYFLIVQFEG